jgi:hypothetical protein
MEWWASGERVAQVRYHAARLPTLPGLCIWWGRIKNGVCPLFTLLKCVPYFLTSLVKQILKMVFFR